MLALSNNSYHNIIEFNKQGKEMTPEDGSPRVALQELSEKERIERMFAFVITTPRGAEELVLYLNQHQVTAPSDPLELPYDIKKGYVDWQKERLVEEFRRDSAIALEARARLEKGLGDIGLGRSDEA